MSSTCGSAPSFHARSSSQPPASTASSPAASKRAAIAVEREGLHHLAVVHQFEMIDRDRRTQRDAIARACPGAARETVSPGCLPSSSSPSSGPLLAKVRPALSAAFIAAGVVFAAGLEEHPVHADRPAQRRIIGHRVGAGAGREAEAEIEQAIPDIGGRLVVGETDDLDIIDLAVGDVGRKLVAQRLLLRRIDVPVERMDVADQRALGVGKVGDDAVVRIGAGQRGMLVGGKIRRQQMVGEVRAGRGGPRSWCEIPGRA